MASFSIALSRQLDGGAAPAAEDAKCYRPALAFWACGVGGTWWLSDLVKAGHATLLRDDGFFAYYTAQARYLVPVVRDGRPPEALARWPIAEWQTSLADSPQSHFDVAALDACAPDEWLLVNVTDND